jgi:copper(I)-binding protein
LGGKVIKRTTIYLTIILALLLAACAKPVTSQIEVKEPWVRAAALPEMQMGSDTSMSSSGDMSGGISAAYMLLRNPGDEPDRLLNVKTDAAEIAELHVTQTENDVTSMRPVESIEVPPQGETELEPGGLHIMLMNLKRELKAGDTIKLTLEFEKAGTVDVEAEVRAP